MRILIQDPASQAFFDGAGWDEDIERAKSFESVTQAEAICRKHNFCSALIVVKFDDVNQDVSYPVGDRGALLVSKPATQRIKSLY
ncbi:MAG TPA: hypothetical protein VMR33_16830 [Candidatus Baltobacteraceae bacterium]|jgi:hypothetical protein|nr:hypothetical protein [Candidatus Baltobacteraceae bacterium]